jgi:hypothetical protein
MQTAFTPTFQVFASLPHSVEQTKHHPDPKSRGRRFLRLLILSTFACVGSSSSASVPTIEELSFRVSEARNSTHAFECTTRTLAPNRRPGQKPLAGRLYFRREPDGSIQKRTETVIPTRPGQSNIIINISNRAGHWRVYEDRALKLNFLPPISTESADSDSLDLSRKKVDPLISIENLDGVPCYRISAPIPESQVQFAKARLKQMATTNSNGKLKSLPTSIVVAKTEYYVGTNDFLLRGQRSLSQSGEVISEVVYLNIVTNPTLADTLFQIPDSLTVVPVSSGAEYAREMASSLKKSLGMKPAEKKPGPSPVKVFVVAAFLFCVPVTYLVWRGAVPGRNG